MPFKLDNRHRAIAQKIYGHPLNHNIQWHDVCSLLERFGDVFETHNGNWALSLSGDVVSFGSIRTRDLTEDQVIRVRHFLDSVGVTVESLKSRAA